MITDYTSLKSAVTAWLERDGDTSLSAQLPTIISMSESWLKRQLVGYQREITTTLAADADGVVALPSDFIGIRSVYFGTRPYKYSISGTSLTVNNGAGYTFDVTYYASLPALSDENTTNWLLELAPDVYLYACMAQASAFSQDWQNAAIYEAKATQFLEELNLQNTVAQYGRAGLVVNGGLAP